MQSHGPSGSPVGIWLTGKKLVVIDVLLEQVLAEILMKSMKNTTTLLPGGPICPGLDLKADGPPDPASAGDTHVARHGLLQSMSIPDSLMPMPEKCVDL
jgi:hypothetical protein